MSIFYSIIKKPSHLIEVFSACNFFKTDKLICYTPKFHRVRSRKPVKLNYQNYINSFDKKDIKFKIEIRKYNIGEEHRLLKNIISKKSIRYLAFSGENTIYRILVNIKRRIISIAITDGPLESLNMINYFIIIKSRKFINYLKIPFLMITYNLFKLRYSFSFLKKKKYMFAKKTVDIYNFHIKDSLKKYLLSNKIHILIIEDPTMTIPLSKIIRKYRLSNKKFCTIGREGVFKIGNKIKKNISILPEVLINSEIIDQVYVNPISSVSTFAKFKKIKTIPLPIKVFHFDGCARIFEKYISKQFKMIK